MSHLAVEYSTYLQKRGQMSRPFHIGRDLGFWELPKPHKGKEREWHVIARVSPNVPFGYRIHPEDEDLLEPIPEELEALELAKKHLKQYSLRRKKTATIKRNLAKRLQKALSKIEELEKNRVGAYSESE